MNPTEHQQLYLSKRVACHLEQFKNVGRPAKTYPDSIPPKFEFQIFLPSVIKSLYEQNFKTPNKNTLKTFNPSSNELYI